MSESEVKAELNGTNGSAMPSFGFPKFALPGVLGELSEQGVARAREGCEKIKAASEEMAEALRETYSSNARSATDYGLKVIEISNAIPPRRSISSSISWAASRRRMSSPCPRSKRARLSTPHPPRTRTCGNLPRSLRRKRVSRSGSASPRSSTRPTERAQCTSKVRSRGRPVG